MRTSWVCQIAVGCMMLLLPFVIVGQAKGGVILESAHLGTTGQSGGASLFARQYLGARFHVDNTVVVDHIGGHLYGGPSPASATLFGAIYRLSGPTAFPADNLTPLAMTTLRPPFPSSDLLVPLSVTLNHGDYALVFGSGLFGANGHGGIAVPADQFATDQASFIFFEPEAGWREYRLSQPAFAPRFVITGVIIPGTVVNNRVVFEPLRSTFRFIPDPSGCPVGFIGTFSFEARLTNRDVNPLTDLFVEVSTLTNGNLLQNADSGPMGVGAQLTVPQQEGFTDGVLSTDEFVDVPFIICLTQRQPFTLVVDVIGVVDTPPTACPCAGLSAGASEWTDAFTTIACFDDTPIVTIYEAYLQGLTTYPNAEAAGGYECMVFDGSRERFAVQAITAAQAAACRASLISIAAEDGITCVQP